MTGMSGCHTYPYVAVFQAKKKPHLTPLQKKKRMAWAMAHGDWEQSRWDKVIFYSDESTFELAVPGDTRMRVIRSEAFHPACLARTGKFPAKLMVWGCIGRSGPGQLHFVQGTPNDPRPSGGGLSSPPPPGWVKILFSYFKKRALRPPPPLAHVNI